MFRKQCRIFMNTLSFKFFWVLVEYPLEGKLGSRQYVGKIVEEKKKEHRIDCLRLKETKLFNGFVYTYPKEQDNRSWVGSGQIKKKLNAPTPYQRALKFDL